MAMHPNGQRHHHPHQINRLPKFQHQIFRRSTRTTTMSTNTFDQMYRSITQRQNAPVASYQIRLTTTGSCLCGSIFGVVKYRCFFFRPWLLCLNHIIFALIVIHIHTTILASEFEFHPSSFIVIVINVHSLLNHFFLFCT